MGMQGTKYQLSNQGFVFPVGGTNAVAKLEASGSFSTTEHLGELEEQELKAICSDIMTDLVQAKHPSERFQLFRKKYEGWATEGRGVTIRKKRTQSQRRKLQQKDRANGTLQGVLF